MFTISEIIIFLLQIISVVIGAYLILKALWIWRVGENERGFLIRGIVGIIIVTFPWWGQILYLLFLAHGVVVSN